MNIYLNLGLLKLHTHNRYIGKIIQKNRQVDEVVFGIGIMPKNLNLCQGCVLIRMMENFLSPAVFRTGLASYFKVRSCLLT